MQLELKSMIGLSSCTSKASWLQWNSRPCTRSELAVVASNDKTFSCVTAKSILPAAHYRHLSVRGAGPLYEPHNMVGPVWIPLWTDRHLLKHYLPIFRIRTVTIMPGKSGTSKLRLDFLSQNWWCYLEMHIVYSYQPSKCESNFYQARHFRETPPIRFRRKRNQHEFCQLGWTVSI